METTPSACDQCTFIGWDVGVVTQKGDTKKDPAGSPPPKKNSISQREAKRTLPLFFCGILTCENADGSRETATCTCFMANGRCQSPLISWP